MRGETPYTGTRGQLQFHAETPRQLDGRGHLGALRVMRTLGKRSRRKENPLMAVADERVPGSLASTT